MTRTAAGTKADLLILGTHQHSLLERLREGCVAREALRHLGVPILCVPPVMFEEPARARLPELRSVLVATDFSDLGNCAIPYAYSVLRGSGGVVELCHVAEKDCDHELLERRLQALFPQEAELHGIQSRAHVIFEMPPGVAIAHTAERLGADAICIDTRRCTALGRLTRESVTKTVVERTRKPVLLVRTHALAGEGR